jgi:hypothetical protein
MRGSVLVVLGLGLGVGEATGQEPAYGAFVFHDTVTVPGTSAAAFDRFVDVDAWWDHRFSENPVRFYIEPKPGGGFWEIFDDQGNGVRHAEVIYVQRPGILRMEGPLGLSGNAIQLVVTLEFTARGDSTVVALEVHGAGEVRERWPQVVRSVWHHFLAERYKPYSDGRLSQ